MPNTEGKAGMAAIVDSNINMDLTKLSRGIKSKLPSYSRPVFIRKLRELPMTGTFKLKKRDLQLEGFDVNKIEDPIYVIDGDGSYTKLTKEKYEDIIKGNVKL